jgi:hypothetical protein
MRSNRLKALKVINNLKSPNRIENLSTLARFIDSRFKTDMWLGAAYNDHYFPDIEK